MADHQDRAGILDQRVLDRLARGDVHVVGRLVQDEEAGLSLHRRGELQAVALSSGQSAHRLVQVVPGEQVAAQRSQDRLPVPKPHGEEGLQDRLLLLQRLLVLGAVADRQARARPAAPGAPSPRARRCRAAGCSCHTRSDRPARAARRRRSPGGRPGTARGRRSSAGSRSPAARRSPGSRPPAAPRRRQHPSRRAAPRPGSLPGRAECAALAAACRAPCRCARPRWPPAEPPAPRAGRSASAMRRSRPAGPPVPAAWSTGRPNSCPRTPGRGIP